MTMADIREHIEPWSCPFNHDPSWRVKIQITAIPEFKSPRKDGLVLSDIDAEGWFCVSCQAAYIKGLAPDAMLIEDELGGFDDD